MGLVKLQYTNGKGSTQKLLERSERMVVEKISEELKNKELLHRIKELEQIVGKKQIELDYYKTAIEVKLQRK